MTSGKKRPLESYPWELREVLALKLALSALGYEINEQTETRMWPNCIRVHLKTEDGVVVFPVDYSPKSRRATHKMAEEFFKQWDEMPEEEHEAFGEEHFALLMTSHQTTLVELQAKGFLSPEKDRYH